MELLTFRIIGHPLVPDSSWLKVGRGLNILRTGRNEHALALLQMLQTINPPYEMQQVRPYGNFSACTLYQHHERKIVPSKKTAALAIFAASPELVEELTTIDAIFYETDRIEFGRRRDHSRWINFIELSGSTRWSEIEPSISFLLRRVKPEDAAIAARLQEITSKLRATDRIKDERAAQFKTLLQALRDGLTKKDRILLNQCLHAVEKSQHFRQAKEHVSARLPLFLFLPSSPTEDSFAFLGERLGRIHVDPDSFDRCLQRINLRLQILQPELALQFSTKKKMLQLECFKNSVPHSLTDLPVVEQFQAALAALTSLHEEINGCPPVFLIDCNRLNVRPHNLDDIFTTLVQYATHLQCLIAPHDDFKSLHADTFAKNEKSEQSLINFRDVLQ